MEAPQDFSPCVLFRGAPCDYRGFERAKNNRAEQCMSLSEGK
jgi:hypothetical protein